MTPISVWLSAVPFADGEPRSETGTPQRRRQAHRAPCEVPDELKSKVSIAMQTDVRSR